MTTYARLVNGHALDCQVAASVADLAERFHPAWLAANPFSIVPDGTLHGAKDNGNGTFTNPPVPPPVVVDRVFNRQELRDYLVTHFGNNNAGRIKVGTILAAFRASTDGQVAFYWDDFDSRSAYEKSTVTALLTFLRSKDIGGVGYITVSEITAVNTNWPTA